MRARPRATISALVLALVPAACSSSVEESLTTSVAADDSTSTSDDSSASVTVTAASMSVSDGSDSVTAGSDGADAADDSATTEGGASTSAGDGGSDETPAEGDSGSADGSEQGTTAAESTGEPVDCAVLDEDACDAAHNDCMLLTGEPLVHVSGPMWCLGDAAFVACAAIEECDERPTVACEDGVTPWLLPSTCLPSGWSGCPAPGNGQLDPC